MADTRGMATKILRNMLNIGIERRTNPVEGKQRTFTLQIQISFVSWMVLVIFMLYIYIYIYILWFIVQVCSSLVSRPSNSEQTVLLQLYLQVSKVLDLNVAVKNESFAGIPKSCITSHMQIYYIFNF